jgi:amino acid adenylation domain-containing protein/non-ribosomal peptide synthase protein (TIGR01720 family)
MADDILPNEQDDLLALLLDEQGLGLPADGIALRDPSVPPPLSFAQQRLWFLNQMGLDGPAYNVPLALDIRGPLLVPALEQSLNAVVARHEVLRTTFTTTNGRPFQVIAPALHIPLDVHDLRALPEAERRREAERLAVEAHRQPFDLARGPLLRAALLRAGDERYTALFPMHHSVSDGWSSEIFLRELAAHYTAATGGRAPALSKLAVQYADFAAWQWEHLQGDVLDDLLDFWTRSLRGSATVLNLPADRPRPPVQSYRGARQPVVLSAELTAALREIGERQGATLFMTLLAAFQVLLYRYTGQEDLLVGSPIANRPRPELEPLIGMFVNTLVLRGDLSGNPRFEELLARVRANALEAYAHQDLPFEYLVEALHPQRDLSHHPLFQVMFALNSAPANLNIPGLVVTPHAVHNGTAKFDLTLTFEQRGQDLHGWFEYNADLFDAETLARMSAHWQTLLWGITADPQRRIDDLPLLAVEELRQVLVGWNGAHNDNLPHECVHALFERHAARIPNAVAVSYEDEQITYRELNRRANQLAHYLWGLGVVPETRVGICLRRSIEMVVALLGVLKAGGAYVPLDPRLPPERLATMLEDAQAPVLISSATHGIAAPPGRAPTRFVDLDREAESIAHQSDINPRSGTRPENLVYVLFTSGSTGRPKGVAVEHRQLVNYVTAIARRLALPPGASYALVSTFAADLGNTVIFPALCGGGQLVIASQDRVADPNALAAYFRAHPVDCLKIVPAHLAALLTAGNPADVLPRRCLVLGGEACDWELIEKLERLAPDCRIINHYGPTETTVGVLAYTVNTGSARRTPVVPLGPPLDNCRVYVLDAHGQPAPVGVPGELYVGGACVARGYLGRPDLTDERFVRDPFSSVPGARLYRTGDLMRYLPDGRLEFLGRIDHQVKIRGFRIELEEIEAVLAQHPGVNAAVVIARDDVPGQPGKRLVAYLACAAENAPSAAELRAFLQDRLPDYMLPAYTITLDALPLTANGKLDRQALPAPAGVTPDDDSGFHAPRTPAEITLARIWTQLLGVERVGTSDNFFELGGDSILSIQMIARASQAGLQLSPRQVFQHQTVAALAAVAVAARAGVAEQGPVTGVVPLTPIQRWFFDQNLLDPHHWNMSQLLETRQAIDPATLERALEHLIVHHDALRLRFSHGESGWEQINSGPETVVPFTVVDLSVLTPAEQARALERRAAGLQAGLRLQAGPLVQAALFDRGPDTPGRLLLAVHHLVVDSVSWRILLEDLQDAYRQLSSGEAVQLRPKTTSFKEWAGRLTAYARDPRVIAERDYWLAELAAPVPALPIDEPAPAGAAQPREASPAHWLNNEASTQSLSISLTRAETHDLLQVVPAAYRTQINDVLLTALARALTRWTGGRTALVDLEGHGREDLFDDVDLSRTTGWFTTHFPVRLTLGQRGDWGDDLRAVKEHLRAVPHRGIGYGLLRYVAQLGELQHPLEPEVSFNYLGQFDPQDDEAAVFAPVDEACGPARSPRAARTHLVQVTGAVRDGQLHVNWWFSERLYQRATIARVAGDYLDALRALIAHCRSLPPGPGTPSDYPLARVDQATLDRLAAGSGGLEQVYPLAPFQREMLAASRAAPHSGVYSVQLSLGLRGDLQVDALRCAWELTVERHGALRTAFVLDDREPLQIVRRQVELPWTEHDWREHDASAHAARLEALLADERARGFAFEHAPLLRLALVRLGGDAYRLIWTQHHTVKDGWSSQIVLKEVLGRYRALAHGLPPPAGGETARPYRDYVAWLAGRDQAEAARFWQDVLRGYRTGAPRANPAVPAAYAEQEVALDPAASAALQALAQKLHVTLGTLVLSAWARVLAAASGRDDVLFGVVSAGRPPALAGIESVVGAFVNVAPARVRVRQGQALAGWLQELHAAQAARLQHDFVAADDVRAWLGLPPGAVPFESVLRFQNYPLDDHLLRRPLEGLALEDPQWHDRWHYPLNVVAEPGPVSASPQGALVLRIGYAPDEVAPARVAALLAAFQETLAGMVRR